MTSTGFVATRSTVSGACSCTPRDHLLEDRGVASEQLESRLALPLRDAGMPGRHIVRLGARRTSRHVRAPEPRTVRHAGCPRRGRPRRSRRGPPGRLRSRRPPWRWRTLPYYPRIRTRRYRPSSWREPPGDEEARVGTGLRPPPRRRTPRFPRILTDGSCGTSGIPVRRREAPPPVGGEGRGRLALAKLLVPELARHLAVLLVEPFAVVGEHAPADGPRRDRDARHLPPEPRLHALHHRPQARRRPLRRQDRDLGRLRRAGGLRQARRRARDQDRQRRLRRLLRGDRPRRPDGREQGEHDPCSSPARRCASILGLRRDARTSGSCARVDRQDPGRLLQASKPAPPGARRAASIQAPWDSSTSSRRSPRTPPRPRPVLRP